MGFLYAIIKKLAHVMLYLFFNNIVAVGRRNIPEGPVIFAVNHPNMLLDVFLVAVLSRKNPGFWAKDTLFKNPYMAKIFHALHVVPVMRRQDHGGEKQDNSMLFSASDDLLNRGESLVLFPEGKSETTPSLAEIKDGASWLFYHYAELHPDKKVPIVPVGLTYLRKDKFRSDVCVTFGPAIFADASRMEAYKADQRTAVKSLSADLYASLMRVTVNAPDWETLRVVHAARRLFMPSSELSLDDYVELTRRFSTGYVEHKDEPEVQKFVTELNAYQAELDALHLRDYHARARMKPAEILWLVVKTLLWVCVLLPVGLIGALPLLPMYAVAKLVSSRSKYLEEKAQAKMLISSILLALCYGGWFVAARVLYGVRGLLLALLLLPLLTLAHIRILDVQMTVLNSVISSVRLLHALAFRRARLESLRRERARLSDTLQQLVSARAKSLPPLHTTDDVASIRLLRSKADPVRLLSRQQSFQDVYV